MNKRKGFAPVPRHTDVADLRLALFDALPRLPVRVVSIRSEPPLTELFTLGAALVITTRAR